MSSNRAEAGGRAIGRIRALYRYPVKSFAGHALTSAALGWHGIDGDRRFAFMRVGDTSGMPWLTAGKLPAMIRYRPCWADSDDPASPPTHVMTPDGEKLELRGETLRQELSAYGEEVRLVQLNHGVFDEASVSLITGTTIAEVQRQSGVDVDERCFRPNIVIDADGSEPFLEAEWVAKLLVFGDAIDGPAVSVVQGDVRCSMVNLDPVTGTSSPEVLKTVVRLNQNIAGVYGSTFRTGTISVGDRVSVIDVATVSTDASA